MPLGVYSISVPNGIAIRQIFMTSNFLDRQIIFTYSFSFCCHLFSIDVVNRSSSYQKSVEKLGYAGEVKKLVLVDLFKTCNI
jgi:hypothetical protein